VPFDLVVSYPGLDVSLTGNADELATWTSPFPFPPVIPFPTSTGNRQRQIAVVISFHPNRPGYTFSPMETRFEDEGSSIVQAERWEGPHRSGEPWTAPLRARIENEELPIDTSMSVRVVFPVASPLEGRGELHVDGLKRNGTPVRFPVVPFWPRYYMSGGSIP
jgi:hypothetical protein